MGQHLCSHSECESWAWESFSRVICLPERQPLKRTHVSIARITIYYRKTGADLWHCFRSQWLSPILFSPRKNISEFPTNVFVYQPKGLTEIIWSFFLVPIVSMKAKCKCENSVEYSPFLLCLWRQFEKPLAESFFAHCSLSLSYFLSFWLPFICSPANIYLSSESNTQSRKVAMDWANVGAYMCGVDMLVHRSWFYEF